jgi:hypothetical protein
VGTESVQPDPRPRHLPAIEAVLDDTKRLAITGPATVHWRDGMREMVEARSLRSA